MFNLLQSANDDQTAIGACLLTIVGAAFLVLSAITWAPPAKNNVIACEIELASGFDRNRNQMLDNPRTVQRNVEHG